MSDGTIKCDPMHACTARLCAIKEMTLKMTMTGGSMSLAYIINLLKGSLSLSWPGLLTLEKKLPDSQKIPGFFVFYTYEFMRCLPFPTSDSDCLWLSIHEAQPCHYRTNLIIWSYDQVWLVKLLATNLKTIIRGKVHSSFLHTRNFAGLRFSRIQSSCKFFGFERAWFMIYLW